MAMYRTASGKNENNTNLWEKYRASTSINFSDIVEDKTIYDQSRSDEISSRLSTWGNDETTNGVDINPDTVSVDDILGNSIVHEIRHLSQSRHDTSRNSSIRSSLPFRFSTSQCPLRSDELSCASSDFRPGEDFNEQMDKDEKSWEQECAAIPQTSVNSISMANESQSAYPKQKKLVNLPDFSMAYLGDSLSGNSDMSMGRFFLNRCDDIRQILSAKSPTKHVPVAIIANSTQSAMGDSEKYSQASSSFYADDESNSNAAPKMSTNTFDKKSSVDSSPTSANHLEEHYEETPQSFIDKLYENKAKPLTKSNVQLLEKTLSQQSQTVKLEMVQNMNQDQYQMYEQYEENNDTEGMLSRMNSTAKIAEQTNEWRKSKGTESTQTADSNGSNFTLDEPLTVSPIKSPQQKQQKNCNNVGKNKRGRSPTPTQPTDIRSPNRGYQQFSQKENVENENGKMNRLPCRLRASNKEPLDDVSSIMNNLRIQSPPTREISKSPKSVMVRKCETDLKQIQMENQLNEEPRRYAAQNRSFDLPKLSLPNYGLHGMRNSNQNQLDKRCNSQMSTHSEFTQNDGKFPLKSNTSELVWECVKLRKSVTKSFVIKNTSEKKLGLKIVVVGPGFQIVSGIESDSVILQGHECRTINVSFCPTIIGKAIGKIIFKPTKNWSEETERSVCLWAYGGSTALQLQGIERGPVGCSFLKMAETSSITSTTLKRSFSIYNRGPLNGVATIFIKPKTNQCINESHILIEPNKCVIRPDCSTVITVSYKLRRKDLERLKEPSCEVLTIGTLEVIFGSEPNRQRIASMLTQRGSIPSTYKQLEFLVNDFPAASMENFMDFREDIDNVSDLFGCFKTSEIALTINRTNLDETQDADLSGMDESVMFRTLIEAPKYEQAVSRPMANHPQSSNDKMWEVHPKRLSLDTRNNSHKSITIQSFFQQQQTFQVDSDYRDYLNFSTTSGQIKPNGEYTISVELKKHIHIAPFNGIITIYFEKGCIEIPIIVQPLPY